jgi:hypothetical protein
VRSDRGHAGTVGRWNTLDVARVLQRSFEPLCNDRSRRLASYRVSASVQRLNLAEREHVSNNHVLEWSRDRAAVVLMSLVGSCKENHVKPWAYLRSVFTTLPENPDLDELLPTAGSLPLPHLESSPLT